MLVDDVPLVPLQRARFVEDFRGDGHLAQVVKIGAVPDGAGLLFGQGDCFCQAIGETGHRPAVGNREIRQTEDRVSPRVHPPVFPPFSSWQGSAILVPRPPKGEVEDLRVIVKGWPEGGCPGEMGSVIPALHRAVSA